MLSSAEGTIYNSTVATQAIATLVGLMQLDEFYLNLPRKKIRFEGIFNA